MATAAPDQTSANPDALPQPLGEFQPLDRWQEHVNRLACGLRGGEGQGAYRTFAAADYRLAHALAAHYYEAVVARERAQADGRRQTDAEARGGADAGGPASARPPVPPSSLLVMEWGPGNGNLAACFLGHLQTLDKAGTVYPRVRYLLVDRRPSALKAALAHPDLTAHRGRVSALCADVRALGAVKDAVADRIVCNELWSELPTKLLSRKDGEIEEEHLRPNLSAARYAMVADWTDFVRAFTEEDLGVLGRYPGILEDLVWEREYHKVEWKDVPYRKTITDFLKRIDERVLVPVNLGAFATVKEAKRLLRPGAVGFSSFDAGTDDLALLNDAEKPCYSQVGGQYSFLLNLALIEAVAKHVGIKAVTIEAQREFVGRSLGTNVIGLMDLLAMHPSSGSLSGWEQDRLILQTMHALKGVCRSPYPRRVEYPLPPELPASEREAMERLAAGLDPAGVPDTVAYLAEEELSATMDRLEELGYEREAVRFALAAPPQPVDYYHCFLQA
jgi:hypothetical protein